MMGFFSSLFGEDNKYKKSAKIISEHKKLDKAFVETFERNGMLLYKNFDGVKIIINEQTKQVCFYSKELCPKLIIVDKFYQDKPLFYRVFNFNEICDLNFQINKKIIAEKNSGIGRAIVGGMLFGAAGAIVGASSAGYTNKELTDNIEILVQMKDSKQPIFRFKAFIGCGNERVNGYGIDEFSHAFDVLKTLVENSQR